MIPLFSVNMPPGVDGPLLDTLHSGYISQGPKVEQFEAGLNKLFKTQYAISLNSGTSALTLALRLAGVAVGTDVISTPMTCSATNLAILSLGGTPVWADVNADTGLLNPESVKAKITSRTKAIMVVDWGGSAPNLEALRKIADDYDIKLIEDSAHSFGAPHTKLGLAHFTCFSLQAIKHITTGDGGVLVCVNQDDYKQGKLLRWFGINREGSGNDSRINEQIENWGYKIHMNDLNATIGIEQLKQLPEVLNNHIVTANYYREQISSYYIHPPKGGVYWLYTLLLPTEAARDRFKNFMAGRGIQVSQVHKRNDHYNVFKPSSGVMLGKWHPNNYPGLNAFSSRMVCIPVNNKLTAEQRSIIAGACNEFAAAEGAV